MGKKAFITGGSGHVGANLIRQLINGNWKVRCLVNKDVRAFAGLDIELVEGNILDSHFLEQKMQGCYAVFHAAAVVGIENINAEEMETINVQGTRAMCNAALLSKIERFIYFSSIHAYEQKPLNSVLNEDRVLVSDSNATHYDLTKARAEIEVNKAHKKGLHTVILNPTGILGPNDFKPSRMGQLITNTINQRIPITINAGFNWVDVRDVCYAAIESVDKANPGNNYILSGKWASFQDLSEIVSKKIGKKTKWATLPFWVAYLYLPFSYLFSKIFLKRPLFSVGSLRALAVQASPSNKKARECFAFDPRPLDETIKDTVDWLVKNDIQ